MSSQVLTPNTESAMLARILQADEQELTLDAARYWLSVKLPASDQDRVDELSAKARAGSLTEAETQELDNYLHIGFLLGTMQAKARRLLPTESTLTPSESRPGSDRSRASGRAVRVLPYSAIGATAPLSNRPHHRRTARRRNRLRKSGLRVSSPQSL